MIYFDEAFRTQGEARAWMDQTYRSYHPAGYGTSLRCAFDPFTTAWRVTGSRFHSCD